MRMRNKAKYRREGIGHTSAVAGLSENENRHRPAPFLRGPSEVFRIVEINSTKLCHGIDSCFTVTKLPLADAWGCKAPVGSNTETDDD